jgi:hypothetical protein
VIEALVGTEHHSATRQTFLHPSLVNLLFRNLHLSKAVRALDYAMRADRFVAHNVLAKDRRGACFTVRNLKLTFLEIEEMKNKTQRN